MNRKWGTEQNTLFIGIGEIIEGKDDQILRIPALGSCVGLVIYPKTPKNQKKVAVMAHIMLPQSNLRKQTPVFIKTEAKYADEAIPRMLRILEKNGYEKSELVAKLVGGARMFGSESNSLNIGKENIIAVSRLLKDHKIPILKKYTGGERGISVRFYVETTTLIVQPTGELSINI